jgi:hypothetical protein
MFRKTRIKSFRMLILDFSQVLMSNVAVNFSFHQQLEEDLLRHQVLNTLRFIRSKFHREYGELVIAFDDRQYWRKEFYPYYKAQRVKEKVKSPIPWDIVFSFLTKFKLELKEFFPYIVIQIPGAEADDIIGTLCSAFGEEVLNTTPIKIVSGDKDFVQLQKYCNVSQFDPVHKKDIVTGSPVERLKEHIMRGDAGDGVPNFLSPDDCFVSGKRQKPIREKTLKEWVKQDPKSFCSDTTYKYYQRNERLIDLSNTPDQIRDMVMKEYNTQAQEPKSRHHLLNYFIQNKLRNLLESISDF